MAEDLLVFERPVGLFGLDLVAGAYVVKSRCVIYNRVLLGLTETFALLGHYMQQLGTLELLETAQDVDELHEVVAVHGPEIAYADGLEEVAAAHGDSLCRGCETLQEADSGGVPAVVIVAVEAVPHAALEVVVAARGRDAREVGVHAADSLVDGYAVVVEHDEEVGARVAHVVEGLESLTAAEGAVADDGDMAARGVALQQAGGGHTESRRDGGGAMAGAESVIGAF